MTPIEEIYALLARYKMRVPKEETETVSELRYGWDKMKKLAESVAENLSSCRLGSSASSSRRSRCLSSTPRVGKDWDANGPSCRLDPIEAVQRLKKFQTTFAVRKRKWDNYSGEELFGLHITPYPELEKIEKEIDMLDKLYSLYSEVNATMDDYADVLWSDVKDQIDGMEEKMKMFQYNSKYLPKSLKDWPAFNDCKKRSTSSSRVPSLWCAFCAARTCGRGTGRSSRSSLRPHLTSARMCSSSARSST